MNVAWCSTETNAYPSWMLATCFEKHTIHALRSLKPNLIILSGKPVHGFEGQLKHHIPNVQVHKTLHYAHREGNRSTDTASKEIKTLVAAV